MKDSEQFQWPEDKTRIYENFALGRQQLWVFSAQVGEIESEDATENNYIFMGLTVSANESYNLHYPSDCGHNSAF